MSSAFASAAIAAIVPLVLGASPALPASFIAPQSWVAKPPPADGSVNFIWLSPRFGINGNGENLSVMTHPEPSSMTLDAEVSIAVKEMSQGQQVVNSRAEPTCAGRQPGWTFDAHLPLPNGKTISQLYHLTIVDAQFYAFIYTRDAADTPDPAVARAIQSICPKGKRAS